MMTTDNVHTIDFIMKKYATHIFLEENRLQYQQNEYIECSKYNLCISQSRCIYVI